VQAEILSEAHIKRAGKSKFSNCPTNIVSVVEIQMFFALNQPKSDSTEQRSDV
jgi:hypothetical protein